MSWSTSELRVRLAPLNWFKPSSKLFYWRFQGGTSFVDFLCFCSVLCLLCLCARLFICALWSPAGKRLTSWLSFVVSTVSLSLSHWYPGSGVILYCIDSWSLCPYLPSFILMMTAFYVGTMWPLPTPKEFFSCYSCLRLLCTHSLAELHHFIQLSHKTALSLNGRRGCQWGGGGIFKILLSW